MLVTNMLSISNNTFYPFNEKLHHLSHNETVVCKCFQFGLDKNFVVVKGQLVKPVLIRQILDSPQLRDFADDDFEFAGNGGKLTKRDRKHCGKRRNCLLGAFFPFPTVFSKDLYFRHVKTRACIPFNPIETAFSKLCFGKAFLIA